MLKKLFFLLFFLLGINSAQAKSPVVSGIEGGFIFDICSSPPGVISCLALPIPVKARFYILSHSNGAVRVIGRYNTDDSGLFQIALTPGSYSIGLVRDRIGEDPGFSRNNVRLSEWKIFTVAAGQFTPLYFTVQPD